MLIWYGAGAVAAILIAWLAALVHASGHAPIGLVSLAVGIALGAVLRKIAVTLRFASRRHLIIGTILLAIVAVLAEHTWLYLDFRRQWREAREKSPQVALFRPESPWSPREYFAIEATPEHAALWCVDAAIIVASAVGTVIALSRNPSPQPLVPSP
jgi:ABC-type uncharacterized transport system permease subunit